MQEVYGYIRVSTETQAEKGYGLSTQENAIQEYCKSHKLKLIDIFKDEGVSGTELNRDGLTDLLASLNGVKTIVVMNTSRLWRSDNAKVMIKRQLIKANAEVMSAEQPTYSIYDKDPNDFLVNGMMELLDQYDRMNTNLKLAKGRRSKVKSGQKGCGVAPIGYKWEHNSDRPIIVVDEVNATIVRDIFKKYLEVKSIGKIQEYCNQKGYLTQRGKSFSAQAINNILKNPFYKGDITHSDLKVEGQHDPIINKIIFGKVQALLERNKRK
ncbi:recombinase family protein [Bacillus subtilis]|uniref:recombinase family protein n=1 Tax=Bacillus subtilis TaxID=1423 RepID=UPI001E522A10|nr:recombinase family protein [Bacillus subtilis]